MTLQRRTESNGGGGGADIPNLEAGEHEGRLVYVADLGLQHMVYKGEDKGNIQQIALGFEILGEAGEEEVVICVDTKSYTIPNPGRPRSVTRKKMLSGKFPTDKK